MATSSNIGYYREILGNLVVETDTRTYYQRDSLPAGHVEMSCYTFAVDFPEDNLTYCNGVLKKGLSHTRLDRTKMVGNIRMCSLYEDNGLVGYSSRHQEGMICYNTLEDCTTFDETSLVWWNGKMMLFSEEKIEIIEESSSDKAIVFVISSTCDITSVGENITKISDTVAKYNEIINTEDFIAENGLTPVLTKTIVINGMSHDITYKNPFVIDLDVNCNIGADQLIGFMVNTNANLPFRVSLSDDIYVDIPQGDVNFCLLICDPGYVKRYDATSFDTFDGKNIYMFGDLISKFSTGETMEVLGGYVCRYKFDFVLSYNDLVLYNKTIYSYAIYVTKIEGTSTLRVFTYSLPYFFNYNDRAIVYIKDKKGGKLMSNIVLFDDNSRMIEPNKIQVSGTDLNYLQLQYQLIVM